MNHEKIPDPTADRAIYNADRQRKDFQGYRRKTIETYNRYMILNGKQII